LYNEQRSKAPQLLQASSVRPNLHQKQFMTHFSNHHKTPLGRARQCGIKVALALALGLGGLAAGPTLAGDPPPKSGLTDVLNASSASDWRALDPDNTLYLELPTGRVVIELAPSFAPNHVANIKALVREHYFDGLAILRAQDNYVVQWGDPNEKEPKPIKTAKKTLAAEFTVATKKGLRSSACPTATATRRKPGLRAACPPHATRRPNVLDWRIAMAWLALAVTMRPTVAAAPSCMW
jgi:cyclophilin family peptidyl-prolyl cis-trans isomerase